MKRKLSIPVCLSVFLRVPGPEFQKKQLLILLLWHNNRCRSGSACTASGLVDFQLLIDSSIVSPAYGGRVYSGLELMLSRRS